MRQTDMKRGDRVRLLRDCRDIRHTETFEAGLAGALGQLYRVQKDVEVWEVLLDRTYRPLGLREVPIRICVSHKDMERIP